MMHIRRLRRTLWLATFIVAAGGCAIVAMALLLPLHVPSPSAPPSSAKIIENTHGSRVIVTDKFLKHVASVSLQRPLIDQPKPMAAQSDGAHAITAKTLNVRLIGTLVLSDRTFGWFDLGQNKIKFYTVGDQFPTPRGLVEVIRLEPDNAVLSVSGRSVTLRRVRSKPQ